MQKKCFFCGSHHVVKNGFRNKTQRYLCKNCGKRFSLRNKVNINNLYDDYLIEKQSIKYLSEKHKVSTRTILRRLHKKEAESLQIQTNNRLFC